MSNKPIVLLGGGGHASVLTDILRENKQQIASLISPMCPNGVIFSDIKVFDSDDDLVLFSAEQFDVVVAIGPQLDDSKRINIIDMVVNKGYTFTNLLSQRVIISEYSSLWEGVQILPGAIINAGANIGEHVVINSRVVIEHDCIIGGFSHFSPWCCILWWRQCGQACLYRRWCSCTTRRKYWK